MKLTLRIGAVLLLLCAALPAAAQSLDQAKAAGQVGERIDGYVGVVDANAPGDIRALVDQVNAERQAKYAEIAAERGIAPTRRATGDGCRLGPQLCCTRRWAIDPAHEHPFRSSPLGPRRHGP